MNFPKKTWAKSHYLTLSVYRPWRRPRFTTDIEPLRKIFEQQPPPVSLPSFAVESGHHVGYTIGGVYASVFPGKNFFNQRYFDRKTDYLTKQLIFWVKLLK